MRTNARGESLELSEQQALRVATLLSTGAVAERIRRREWIAGGNNHSGTLGVRACRRCGASTGRVPAAECYDFELLHSLCVAVDPPTTTQASPRPRRRQPPPLPPSEPLPPVPTRPLFRRVETIRL